MWGQIIGAGAGLLGGLLNDAFNTSEDDAERRAMQQQQAALDAIRRARGYIPEARVEDMQAANASIAQGVEDDRDKAIARNQRYALNQIAKYGRDPSGGY